MFDPISYAKASYSQRLLDNLTIHTATITFEGGGINKIKGELQATSFMITTLPADYLLAKRTGRFLSVVPNTTVSIEYEGGKMYLYEYKKDFSYIGFTSVESQQEYILTKDTHYIKFSYGVETHVSLTWESGSIGADGSLISSTSWLRTSNYIDVDTIDKMHIRPNGRYNLRLYDANYDCIGSHGSFRTEEISLEHSKSLWNMQDGKTKDDVKYVRFIIGYVGGGTISHNDVEFAAYKAIENREYFGAKVTFTGERQPEKNIRVSDNPISFYYSVGDAYNAGLLKLPTNYSPTGEPVKLIIFCHGSNDFLAMHAPRFSTSYDPYIQYLCDEGYAIYDCYGGTSKYNTHLSINSPTQASALVRGYEWIINNFNVSSQGVYVTGKSWGGKPGVGLCFRKDIPVLACGLLTPSIDVLTVNLGFTKEARMAAADDFGFEDVGNLTAENILNVDEIDRMDSDYRSYIEGNAHKLAGHNPQWAGLMGHTPIELAQVDFTNLLWETTPRVCSVPVKIWCAPDDDAVNYESNRQFIESIKLAQGVAEMRTMPSGTGGHHATDTSPTALKAEMVTTKLGVTYQDLPLAYVELIEWFRRYDN